MKLLQNKSTGEIGCLICSFGKTPEKITIVQYIDRKRGSKVWYYNSLAELTEEWEDYEEPKGYWYYDTTCGQVDKLNHNEDIEIDSSIGNCFETKEEAEKAVKKLKAWKRLKDKGFRFKTWGWDDSSNNEYTIYFTLDSKSGDTVDLDLLFGGEE